MLITFVKYLFKFNSIDEMSHGWTSFTRNHPCRRRGHCHFQLICSRLDNSINRHEYVQINLHFIFKVNILLQPSLTCDILLYIIVLNKSKICMSRMVYIYIYYFIGLFKTNWRFSTVRGCLTYWMNRSKAAHVQEAPKLGTLNSLILLLCKILIV